MQYTTLGSSGLIVSRLAFGSMTFTRDAHFAGITKTTGGDVDAIVGQAIDGGINFFDTADIYSAGQSEEVLGAALASRRGEVVIATKVRGRMGEALVQAGLSKRNIHYSIDQSLRRLGTDWVDLYIAHWEDAYTPLEETLEALDAVVRSGKARYIGFSNWAPWKVAAALEMQKANGWARFTHGQVYYSLVGRDVERDMVPMARHYGLGLTCWSPLGGGLLSGRYTRDTAPAGDDRLASFDFIPTDKAKAFDILDAVREIAVELDASVAQVALAWLLTRPAVSSVIVGASKPHQLADNLGAADIVLPDAALARLDALGRPETLYPQWHNDMFHDAAARAALGR
ncbi:aldo/keto reductase [Novosphingobium colocasiae]|uniref:aldo/keto reductase n=1 Tax=Novosphingobium colocasiae TaxID=1256513 RepID=UPI0035AE0651